MSSAHQEQSGASRALGSTGGEAGGGRDTAHGPRTQASDAIVVAALSAAAAAAAAASATSAVSALAHVVGTRPAPLVAGVDAAVLIGCLGVAVVTPALVRFDVAQRRLPNPLVGVVAGSWIVALVLVVMRGDVESASSSLLWALAAAVIGVSAAVTGGLGMGDVKLGAVLTGLVAEGGPCALLCLWGLSGVLAVTVAGVRMIRSTAGRRRRRPAERSPPVRGVPFGPCLLAAFWAIVIGRVVLDGDLAASAAALAAAASTSR